MLRYAALTLFLTLPSFAQTARLLISDQTLNPGQTVVAPLSIASAGQTIAAIQFDLQWESPLTVQLIPGEQLRAAAKIPYTASPTFQTLRCLVAGMNQTAIADGELLKLFFSADPAASDSVTHVSITNIVAADPNGSALVVGASPAAVQVQRGSPVQFLPTDAILNAAGLSPGPLSPGEIITIFGANSPPATSLKISGALAPILYSGPAQMNAIVPFGLDLGASAMLEIRYPQRTAAISLPVARVTPGLFATEGTGVGAGAALNEDYTMNSLANPARPGSVVTVYGTGFGVLQSTVSDGQPVTAANSAAATITATVAGLPATVLYAGAAPGLIAGMDEVDLRLPAGVVHNSSAPVVVTINGSSSVSNVVTIAIQ